VAEDEREEFRRVAARLESLLREVAEMRAEVKALAEGVDRMNQTFRQISVHLGVAAEPYRRRKTGGDEPPTGFA
jgi:uncharacterized protein YpbB